MSAKVNYKKIVRRRRLRDLRTGTLPRQSSDTDSPGCTASSPDARPRTA
jgi:hypothetical protein